MLIYIKFFFIFHYQHKMQCQRKYFDNRCFNAKVKNDKSKLCFHPLPTRSVVETLRCDHVYCVYGIKISFLPILSTVKVSKICILYTEKDVIKTTNKKNIYTIFLGHLWWNGTHLRYIIIIFWNMQPETISFIFLEFDNEQILLENSDTWFSSTANTRFNYICKMFVFCIFYVINCIVQLK